MRKIFSRWREKMKQIALLTPVDSLIAIETGLNAEFRRPTDIEETQTKENLTS
jgi:hypothetical protein